MRQTESSLPSAGKPAAANDDLLKQTNEQTRQKVSLNQAESANSASQAIERKIIRNANLTIEVPAPTETERRITSIAESHGGFVAASKMTQQTIEGKSKPEMVVNLVVRVPAAEYSKTMEEIRALASRMPQKEETTQDVTEEFIDLEARIRNQKALEAQFLEIMKRATKVEDALDVQKQIADVRTEIEKLEGRKRFLENQTSLSTINVSLQTPTPFVTVTTTGFWYNVKSAVADGIEVAVAIVLFLIRAFLALLPVFILIFLPLGLIVRFLVRRARRLRPTPPSPPPSDKPAEAPAAG